MAIEIKAPTFPESVADGTVATWHKKPGDVVKRDELIVDILDLNPSQLSTVADELSTLWPGFLAPAGVSLRILDGQTWDHEAMALRSFTLRHQEP